MSFIQLPAGTILPYAGSSAPGGFVLCDGSAISRTTYANLFAILGTTWGAGNGTTTFNVPDLRGRAPIGAGTGSGLTARTLGANVGAETANIAHTHTVTAHNHQVTAPDGVNMGVYGSGGTVGLAGSSAVTGAGGGYTLLAASGAQTTTGALYTSNASPTTDSQGSTTQSIMQPSAVVTYIVKF